MLVCARLYMSGYVCLCVHVCMYEYTCEWGHCVTHMCVHIQAYLYLSVDVRVYVYGFVSMYYV